MLSIYARIILRWQSRGRAQQAQRPAQSRTAKVSIKKKPELGSKDAPLTVVEFTDYQCPYCLRFTKTTFPQLKKKYIDTGKVH